MLIVDSGCSVPDTAEKAFCDHGGVFIVALSIENMAAWFCLCWLAGRSMELKYRTLRICYAVIRLGVLDLASKSSCTSVRASQTLVNSQSTARWRAGGLG